MRRESFAPPPFGEVVVDAKEAGDLACFGGWLLVLVLPTTNNERLATNLQLRDSVGLAPTSPFVPARPGVKAPQLHIYLIAGAVYSRKQTYVKKRTSSFARQMDLPLLGSSKAFTFRRVAVMETPIFW